MNCVVVAVAALVSPLVYIILIHYFDYGGSNRNHPTSIRRRSLGALVSCIFNLVLSSIILLSISSEVNLLQQFGLSYDGLLLATVLPLGLTLILFLGSTALEIADGTAYQYVDINFWKGSLMDLQLLRSWILAPVTEEISFRACSVPLLSLCLSPRTVTFLCPLPFSFAHYHHVLEKRRYNGWLNAFLECTFQAGYTYIFGCYATYLFQRTGHIVAPILSHVYCNFMGFPPFLDILEYKSWRSRLFFILCYCSGLILWCTLLNPLTEPILYQKY